MKDENNAIILLIKNLKNQLPPDKVPQQVLQSINAYDKEDNSLKILTTFNENNKN